LKARTLAEDFTSAIQAAKDLILRQNSKFSKLNIFKDILGEDETKFNWFSEFVRCGGWDLFLSKYNLIGDSTYRSKRRGIIVSQESHSTVLEEDFKLKPKPAESLYVDVAARFCASSTEVAEGAAETAQFLPQDCDGYMFKSSSGCLDRLNVPFNESHRKTKTSVYNHLLPKILDCIRDNISLKAAEYVDDILDFICEKRSRDAADILADSVIVQGLAEWHQRDQWKGSAFSLASRHIASCSMINIFSLRSSL